MQRVPLVDVCLMAKSLGVADVPSFLAAAPDPPESSAVDRAIQELQALGALTPEQELTSLGRLLALLPGKRVGRWLREAWTVMEWMAGHQPCCLRHIPGDMLQLREASTSA